MTDDLFDVRDRVVLVTGGSRGLGAAMSVGLAERGARVVIAEGVDPQRVTQDFSAGVPFAAALRVLCDACGYRIVEREGVYHILK